jgi:hypothetical protein
VRRKAHSNRWKALREIAREIARKDPSKRAYKVVTVPKQTSHRSRATYWLVPNKLGLVDMMGRPLMDKVKATYAKQTRLVAGCPRAIYKQLKGDARGL